ncbi:MAG: YitT family protein [Clostridia bacterium]|nr:YitT family protein [Clostridia bacterium]
MRSIKRNTVDIIFYLIGCGIYSAAVVVFTDPNEISPGGVTGIALLLQHFFSLPAGIMVFIINVPLIIIGFLRFGGRFIIGTALATAIMSFSLDLAGYFLKPYYTDGILASVFGGIMMGAGLSFVLLRGATTGGADIAAKLINNRFPYISMGRIILALDLAVVTISAICYKNFESALYSVISLYISSRVLDGLLYGTDRGKLIHIITQKPKEISDSVFRELKRGVTVLSVTGGYTGEERSMLLCAMRPAEVSSFQRLVRAVDPDAFLIISDAGAILGQGFKKNE